MAMEKMGMGSKKETQMTPHKSDMTGGGHLYMQTNEKRNCVVHYRRAADGTLTEAERINTGGAGSGEFKPISGKESAPNAFEVRGASFCRRIDVSCLLPTAATIRCLASP